MLTVEITSLENFRTTLNLGSCCKTTVTTAKFADAKCRSEFSATLIATSTALLDWSAEESSAESEVDEQYSRQSGPRLIKKQKCEAGNEDAAKEENNSRPSAHRRTGVAITHRSGDGATPSVVKQPQGNKEAEILHTDILAPAPLAVLKGSRTGAGKSDDRSETSSTREERTQLSVLVSLIPPSVR